MRIFDKMDTRKGRQWFLIEKKARRQSDEVNIIFWNIAGLTRKDFWDYIHNYDCVALLQKWAVITRWDKIKPLLPKGYNWRCQYAKKEKKKSRAV